MTLQVSEQVRKAIEAGYTPACDGAAAVAASYYTPTEGAAPYHLLNMRAGDRHVQVSISPAGRSVRVFVDGVEAPYRKRGA